MLNSDFLKLSPATQIVKMLKRIYDKNMTTSSGGNLSIKDNFGNIWITPSQIDKGRLSEDDIIQITPNGKFIGKHLPSSEYPFHTAIYQKRPDINSIIHAHPVNLLAFVITDTKIKMNLIPQFSNIIGNIGYSSYAPVGSIELAKSISSAFKKDVNTVMMQNHGIVIGTSNILKAFYKAETLNLLAHSILKSKQHNNIDLKFDNENKTDFQTSNKYIDLKEKLLYYAKRSYDKNLTTSISGNFSVRIDDDNFLMLVSGIDKEFITVKDIFLFSINKNINSSKNDISLHASIYKNNSEFNAIIFATPPNIMSFVCSQNINNFNLNTIPESSIVLKNFEIISYSERYFNHKFVSNKISTSIPCILCQNDGLIVGGNDLFQAFDRVEVAESTASSLLNANTIGKLNEYTQ